MVSTTVPITTSPTSIAHTAITAIVPASYSTSVTGQNGDESLELLSLIVTVLVVSLNRLLMLVATPVMFITTANSLAEHTEG